MLGRFPTIKEPFPIMLEPFPIIMGITLHLNPRPEIKEPYPKMLKPRPEIKEQQGGVKYRFFEGETNCE